jgi:uncharacterized delta-60 repeat protein
MARSIHSIRALAGFTLMVLWGLLAVAFAASPAANEGLATDFAGFGNSGTVVDAPLQITAVALQPDGMLVAAGVRQQTFALARYTSKGELDRSFGMAGVVTTEIMPDQQRADAFDVALESDGSIVVAGTVTGPAGSDFALVRYNAEGVLDPGFDGDGKAVIDFDGEDDRATALGIDGQGRIVVGGAAQFGTRFDFVALRLTSEGALDPSFNDDGKARVAFTGTSFASDLVIQPGGEIVLAGLALVELKAVEPAPVFALARLDAQGKLDPTFDEDGMVTTAGTQGSAASGVAFTPDSKLVVVGTGAEGSSMVLVRYTIDGALDDTFANNGLLKAPFGNSATIVSDVVIMPNSRIVVAGESQNQWAFAGFFPDGTADNTFDGDGRLLVDLGQPGSNGVRSLVRASDGRLLAAGGTVLLRMFADGTPDGGGRQLTAIGPQSTSGSLATLVQPDGKIVGVGYNEVSTSTTASSTDLALVRYLPSGVPDPSFGNAGTSILGSTNNAEVGIDGLLLPDGKIFVVGSSDGSSDRTLEDEDMDLLLARFSPDGTPDRSCGDEGFQIVDTGDSVDDLAQAVARQADGKILVAGTLQGSDRTFVLRLQTNCGLPDPSFGNGGLSVLDKSLEVVELLVLPDGQIQLVGMAETGGVFLARLAPDGTFDSRFGSGGRVSEPLQSGAPNAAAVLADGKLLVVATRFVDGAHETLLRRYTSSGAPDLSFGEQGVIAVNLGSNMLPTALVLRDDNAFALVSCHEYALRSAVALFVANGGLDPSFGTGGIATLTLGEQTCLQDAVFSDRRLFAGGFAEHGAVQSFALAAYHTDAQQPPNQYRTYMPYIHK